MRLPRRKDRHAATTSSAAATDLSADLAAANWMQTRSRMWLVSWRGRANGASRFLHSRQTKGACKAAFFAVIAATDALALHVSLPAPHGFQYPGHAPLRPGLAAAFFACQAAVSAAVHASRAAALAANGAAYGVGETLRIRSLVAIGGVQYCHASAFIACRAAVSAAVHASRAAALAVGDAAACCPRWATPVLSSEWEEGEYGFEPTYLGTWEDDVASAIAESEVPSYMEAAQWDY